MSIPKRALVGESGDHCKVLVLACDSLPLWLRNGLCHHFPTLSRATVMPPPTSRRQTPQLCLVPAV